MRHIFLKIENILLCKLYFDKVINIKTKMPYKLVCIVGQMGVGKTTCAELLKKHGFTEEYFAKPLKEFAISIGFTNKEIYGTQEEKLHVNEHWQVSGREFMQKFGTEVCRRDLPRHLALKLNGLQFWARALEIRVKEHFRKNPNSPLVISDGRFADECRLIKELGGLIIKVKRNTGLSHVNHASENTDDIPVDYTIDNNGTIVELEEQLMALVDELD